MVSYTFSPCMLARTHTHVHTHAHTQTHNRVFVFVTSLEGCVSAVTRDIQTGRDRQTPLAYTYLNGRGRGYRYLGAPN